jgi:D-alanyl-lipoteichoic acid acyltransferase DltB (MBOAT superfamily)
MAEGPLFFILLMLITVMSWNVLSLFQKKSALMALSLFFIFLLGLPSLMVVVSLSLINFLVARQLNTRPFLYQVAVGFTVLCILLFNRAGILGNAIDEDDLSSFSVSSLPLVLGLSFYGLQQIAYLTDVMKKRIIAEEDFFLFLLTSAYFPKFICGPIMQHQVLAPQLGISERSVSLVESGVNRILLGLFKKLVIADRLAPSVNSVFDYNDTLPGLTVLCGAALFTVQLYFDFSAYSDLAIGGSRLFGITLKENFDFPLRSSSVTVFWRKWHQSLLDFFSAYVFLPFSFRFRDQGKWAIAGGIVLTFFLSGIWHGIGFTFLVWSLCHIFYLLFEYLFFPSPEKREKLSPVSRIPLVVYTFILVSVSNIFFRSTGFQSCKHLLTQFRQLVPGDWLVEFIAPLAVGGHQQDRFNFYLSILLAVGFLFSEKRIFKLFNGEQFRFFPVFVILLLIFVFGVFGNGERFIYMQF